jgi:hypothetical protein
MTMKKTFFAIYFILFILSTSYAQDKDDKRPFTETLMQDNYTFTTTGSNQYFILEPGYQLVLEGTEDDETVRLVITVLDETKKIGNIETRVVEENESINGETIEISRNFFAFCEQTSSVYYFGEEVDIYKDGEIVNHSGAWIAEGDNKAGIMMPGLILLGARYYQEIAPGIAMDRAEIISMTETLQTPAGNFTDCLKVQETTALNPNEMEYKIHAPGIGLIKDEDLLLVKYSYVK